MRSPGWSPGWDGHLLMLYNDETQRRAGVAAWVRRGLELGSKILFTEASDERPARSLPSQLGHEPGALDAIERGQIEVVPSEPTTYDTAFMEAVVDGALHEGYPSVRWAGEASTAWDVIPRPQHVLLEQATDELCTTRPLSVLCQYAAMDSRQAVGLLSQTHGGGVREKRLQAAPVDGGLAVAGELDITNQEVLTSLLVTATASTAGDQFVVDLGRVAFLDLPGARALLLGTESFRGRGGHVRLEAPRPHVAHLIRLLGIDHTEGIEMGEAR